MKGTDFNGCGCNQNLFDVVKSKRVVGHRKKFRTFVRTSIRRDLRACRRGLRACRRGLRAYLRGLRAHQRDLRVCQSGQGACQRGLSACLGGWMDGWMEVRADVCTDVRNFSPIYRTFSTLNK